MCLQILSTDKFYKNNFKSDKCSVYCKICHKIYYNKNKELIQAQLKKSYYKNREKRLKSAKDYNIQNKEKRDLYGEQRRLEYPWKIIYNNIKQRCLNKNHPRYKYYGGRGIKCLITKEELKEIWFRDKAYLLKKPSIDCKDNDENYEYSNCQFIEQSENSTKDSIKPILQYDLRGNFIKEWRSRSEAVRKLKINKTGIQSCLAGKCKTSGGFIWKEKE